MLLLPSLTVAARCNIVSKEHTDIYYDWHTNLFDKTFFLNETFFTDPSIICTPVTRQSYIQLLQDYNISCSGDWCIDGQFKCLSNNNNCYHVEHIIDTTCSIKEFEYMDKNILGNVIMAYGLWNIQVGQLSWSNVEAEKREIYKSYIFDNAIKAIRYCNQQQPPPSSVTTFIASILYLVIGIMLLLTLVVIVVTFIRCFLQNTSLPSRYDVEQQ